MKKQLITKAHKAAKKAMPSFEKQYGAEEGKNIAYATMMKLAKEKKLARGGVVDGLAEGGVVSGGPLREHKAKRPNPYDGNEREADEVQGELERQNFAEGGKAKKGAVMAIVARLAKKPSKIGEAMNGEEEGEEVEMEEEGEEGSPEHESMEKAAKHAAASEVMDALKSGDVEALAEALSNFHKSMAYGGMAGKE